MVISLINKWVEWDWKWEIFIYGEEVVWTGTWDMEEDENIIFDSDIGGVNLKKVV